jgi:polar amino acid transport system ATP-binding protein
VALISITDLHKSFGQTKVLSGIDLDIEAGEVVAMIGRSGSGKSTLLRCINGLESVDRGTIRINGRQLDSNEAVLRSLRLTVGMVFQQFNLFPHHTALGNVMLSQMVVKKTKRAEAERIAREMLERVGLGSKADSYPDRLSGGQQQRVAIARALSMQPAALLCDEITSALDPELVGEVLQVVRDLATSGIALVMVTHEMRFARDVCDRVIFMHQGRVHEIGPPADFFDNPGTPELRQFLGVSTQVAPSHSFQ